MTQRILIDDCLVQIRAALLEAGDPVRFAITGLSGALIAGRFMAAKVSKRLPGGDCLVTLETGDSAHLSARRGGKTKDLTQGAALVVEIVRAPDGDKLAEVKRPQDAANRADWDEVDQLLEAAGEGFDSVIEVGSRALWETHVPRWQARHPHLSHMFRQAFRAPGQLLADSGASDVLAQLMQQRWPLPGGGDIRFKAAHGITVLDVNGPDALAANLAAAKALPRLFIRAQIGGLKVVDFIDLKRHSDQNKVLEAFDASCSHAGLDLQRTGWSKFGMVELRSRRIGPSLPDLCLRMPGAAAYHGPHIVCAAANEAATMPPRPLTLSVGPDVVPWLDSQSAAEKISARTHVSFTVVADPALANEAWRLAQA